VELRAKVIAILVVEDESAIRHMLNFRLSREGFTVVEAEDVEQGWAAIKAKLPDLVLLDWMLPNTSGLEFLRMLREDEYTREFPVIMLTARGEEQHRVAGLDHGADDYVTKPFSIEELVARIRALLRRVTPEKSEEPVVAEGLELDPVSHRVVANGGEVHLGPTEFRLLRFFMNHQDRVFSRRQLLDRVWGKDVYVEDRTVDVHIRRLRRTLEPTGFDRFVQTVRGTGYRFSQRD
jgi:two-component system phosphate regulon response regulator PhoB